MHPETPDQDGFLVANYGRCRDLARVSEGTRTPDRRDHNPELYQLSYAHREEGESRWSGLRLRSPGQRPAASRTTTATRHQTAAKAIA
jgi:hypothetical protein